MPFLTSKDKRRGSNNDREPAWITLFSFSYKCSSTVYIQAGEIYILENGMYKIRDFVLSCLISTSSKMICVSMRFYFLTSINWFLKIFMIRCFYLARINLKPDHGDPIT